MFYAYLLLLVQSRIHVVDIQFVRDSSVGVREGIGVAMTTAKDPPYIVLMGGVGSGKSKLVEKLTGETGRASDDPESATRNSEAFYSFQNRLIVSDTPGSNSCSDQFEHNMWIATAFNFMPVSKIFIVVKADCGRIDGIISGIREFSDRFVDLDEDPLGVIVTHMDKVKWPAEDIKRSIADNLGIDDVVFSKLDTPSEELITSILRVCGKKLDLSINHDNFLRIFPKLHKNTPRALLKFCNREVENFKKKNSDFKIKRVNFGEKDNVDLVFEFQAFMKQEIIEIQKRMAVENNLTFDGEKNEKYNQVAYVQNLTNQLRCILHEVRLEGLAFLPQAGQVGAFRQCPHCKEVWTKVQGCEGQTTCGNRPTAANDVRDKDYSQMATFTFKWDQTKKDLEISRGGNKFARGYSSSETKGKAGCGKSVVWDEMAVVQPAAEFSSTAALVKTTDIPMLPECASTKQFNQEFDDTLASFQGRMSLGPKKPNSVVKKGLYPDLSQGNKKY